jgi:hypothetical protein
MLPGPDPWPRPGSHGLELNSLHFHWDTLAMACYNPVAPGQAGFRDLGSSGSGSEILVSFKSVGMNHSEESFTFERRSWLFSKGLPATCPLVPCNGRRVALAQARRAGDISKKIPPGPAVVTYVGFTPWKPWESPPGSSKPHI